MRRNKKITIKTKNKRKTKKETNNSNKTQKYEQSLENSQHKLQWKKTKTMLDRQIDRLAGGLNKYYRERIGMWRQRGMGKGKMV